MMNDRCRTTASAGTPSSAAINETIERCETCGHDTRHEVSVELRTESTKQENAQFSREPYRVTQCRECGARGSQRMNNA